jgi:hypothetical protein
MALPSSILRRDTRANQPVATAVAAGTLYFVTDEGVLERSSGTAWQTYSGSAGAHAPSHQNGGADELTVAGLSGLLADGQTPLAHATSHKSGGSDAVKLDELAAPTDITTLNASAGAHGLLPKLSTVTTEFLNGAGAWATPAGGGSGALLKAVITPSMAQLNVANVTPVPVLAAPGANKMVKIIWAVWERNVTSAASVSGGSGSLEHVGDSVSLLAGSISPTLNVPSHTVAVLAGLANQPPVASSIYNNIGIELVLTAGSTGGAGTFTLTVFYVLVDLQ